MSPRLFPYIRDIYVCTDVVVHQLIQAAWLRFLSADLMRSTTIPGMYFTPSQISLAVGPISVNF
jgi:hypothetical protein